MGVMNDLRDKYGKYVIFAIGFAILAFVMYDLFSSNSAIINGRDNSVGEIAGEEISAEEFQSAVNEIRARYEIRSGRVPSENEMQGIRQQAWDLLISRKAYQKEYDKLGMTVSSEELRDMTRGKNLHPSLESLFKDPETGKVDGARIAQQYQYWSGLPEGSPEKMSIRFFEQDLPRERIRIKYDNLLNKTDYTTEAESRKEYSVQNDQAEIKYLYVPYYSINDSSVQVSDAQLKDYLNTHKEEYKAEHSRSIKYVEVPVVASSADTAYWRDDLKSLVSAFEATKTDSLYAKNNSDGNTFYTTYRLGRLPEPLKSNLEGLKEGDVKGPYLIGPSFKLYKVVAIDQDSLPSAKARHILVKWGGGSEEEKAMAMSKAKDILKEVKDGAEFAAVAREKSEGPSSSNGGELGWFTEKNAMVPEFDKAVFADDKIGIINDIVETEFGYHIIKVEDRKRSVYKVAEIERLVSAGKETIDEAYRTADYFAGTSKDEKSFESNAKEKSLTILTAEDIAPQSSRVGNINSARPLVRWLFNEASKGQVSPAFDLDDRFVVAMMAGEQKKGYSDLEKVRPVIALKVRNQLKAKQIIDKLKGLSGDLDQVASTYGADARVYTSGDVKLGTASLPSVGRDDTAVGKAFGLKKGEKTPPFAGENGVMIIQMNNMIPATEIADYSTYKNQLQQSRGTSYKINQAVREFADIEDKRYKSY